MGLQPAISHLKPGDSSPQGTVWLRLNYQTNLSGQNIIESGKGSATGKLEVILLWQFLNFHQTFVPARRF